MIMNVENSKRYIGQAKNINSRWHNHRLELRGNKKKNRHLQAAWNFHGENKFAFHIIEECSKEALNNRETYWIRYYKTTDSRYGYNVFDEITHDDIQEFRNKKKETISLNRLNRKESSCREVIAINMQDSSVSLLSSYKEVAVILKATEKQVQSCLATYNGSAAKKKVWSVKDFILIYEDIYDQEQDYVNLYKERLVKAYKVTALSVRKSVSLAINKQPREGSRIRATSIENGEQKEFSSKKLMCRELGLLVTKVTKCLKQQSTSKQHRGYKFELI